MPSFHLCAGVIGLSALFSLINQHTLRLPTTAALLLLSALAGGATLLADRLLPDLGLRQIVAELVEDANLPRTVLQGALGFLLFAAAYNVDLRALWRRKWTVLVLATLGVAASTLLLGLAMHAAFALAGLDLSLAWCLAFGALVAPTDPVAVAEVLRRVGLPPGLQATISGESLFNDGAGVIGFVTLAGVAAAAGAGAAGPPPLPAEVAFGFLTASVGAALLGTATGWLALCAMRSVDEVNLELMISLALVTITYSLGEVLDLSAPIAVATAGLLIGHYGPRRAISPGSRGQIETFWSLVDGLLNALLFLAIGFQLVVIQLTSPILLAATAAIPLALLARAVSVLLPTLAIPAPLGGRLAGIAILSWGGLRGGVSVALALTLPPGPWRDPLLAACYAVVLFTVLVQGLTLERLVRRLQPTIDAATRRHEAAAPG
ncbi:MAG: sodium:proton antiporter [Dongiaceae bacterium]